MLEINKIYNIDCLEGLKLIDDNSIDLIVTDPPYNIKLQEWDNLESGKYIKLIIDCLDEFKRIIKDDGSIYLFGTTYSKDFIKIMLFIHDNFNFINHIKWCKNSGISATKNKFIKQTEDIIFFSKNKKYKFYPQYQFSFFENVYNRFKKSDKDNDGIIYIRDLKESGEKYQYNIRIKRGQKDDDIFIDITKENKLVMDWWYFTNLIHKEANSFKKLNFAVKPLELIKRCITASSDINDIILDCFVGSGTTMVACKQLNRNFIGFEISKLYCEVANNRLNLERKNE